MHGAQRQFDRAALAGFGNQFDEGVHHGRVVALAAIVDQEGERLFRPQRALDQGADLQRIVVVHHAQDAGTERDRHAGQVIRVAGAIEAFVVVADQRGDILEPLDGHQQVLADLRVLHDLGALVGGQHVEGLAEQLVGQAELADIVQQAGQHDVLHLGVADRQALRQVASPVGDAAAMPGQDATVLAAAQFAQTGEDLNAGQEGFFQFAMGFLDHGQGLADFRRALGYLLLQTGVEGLQLLVLGLGEGGQAAVLGFQAAAVEGFAYRIDDLVVVPRLGDVAVDLAFVDGSDGRGHVGIAGEQDAQRVWPALADFLEEGGAIHLRHAHVGDDQVDRFLFEQREAGGAAFSDQDAVAVRPEEATQRGQDAGFVIDEEQGGGGGGFAHREVSGEFSGGLIGRMRRKVVPMPSSLSTSIRP